MKRRVLIAAGWLNVVGVAIVVATLLLSPGLSWWEILVEAAAGTFYGITALVFLHPYWQARLLRLL